jgi:hypothetical protein
MYVYAVYVSLFYYLFIYKYVSLFIYLFIYKYVSLFFFNPSGTALLHAPGNGVHGVRGPEAGCQRLRPGI